MGNKLYVPKKDVAGVLFLARSMQELSQREELEARVTERLPVRSNGGGIPEDVMYEMGELERTKSEYVQRAMQLYAGNREGIFEALRGMGAVPSKGLRYEWLKEFSKRHGVLVTEFLNNETNPSVTFNFSSESNYFNGLHYVLNFTGPKKKGFFADPPKSGNSGIVRFSDENTHERPVSADVNLIAFTPTILNLFSNSIKDLTLQMPEVSSCSVVYHLSKNGFILGDTGYRFRMGDDPY